jgi:hypothetical protein
VPARSRALAHCDLDIIDAADVRRVLTSAMGRWALDEGRRPGAPNPYLSQGPRQ